MKHAKFVSSRPGRTHQAATLAQPSGPLINDIPKRILPLVPRAIVRPDGPLSRSIRASSAQDDQRDRCVGDGRLTESTPGRRRFLTGRFAELDSSVIRPPGAAAGFEERCTGCADCVRACPEAILVMEGDGRPVVDFMQGACIFCGDCAEACRSGALVPSLLPDWPWRAKVGNGCLSMQGITCRACEDACEARAIRFRLATGGRSRPILDMDQCSGCGACASACPTQVISFERQEPATPRD